MWKLKQHYGTPLITTIPAEFILNITNNLRLDEVILFPGVPGFFYNTIPPPTHQQLLKAETEKRAHYYGLLTCGGCLRLRDRGEFSDKFMMPSDAKYHLVCPGFRSREVKAAQKFCHECGVRPLPGEFRYWLGSLFHDQLGEHGLVVRCKRCGMDRSAYQCQRKANSNCSLEDYEAGLCEPCLAQEKGGVFLKLMRKRTEQLSKLEGLSKDLTKIIIKHLDFPDCILLRLVS